MLITSDATGGADIPSGHTALKVLDIMENTFHQFLSQPLK